MRYNCKDHILAVFVICNTQKLLHTQGFLMICFHTKCHILSHISSVVVAIKCKTEYGPLPATILLFYVYLMKGGWFELHDVSLSFGSKSRHRWDNIKMDFKETGYGCVDLIYLTHCRVQWQAFVVMAVNRQALIKGMEFFYLDQVSTFQEKWLLHGMN
jgi:hypothetical protein